MNRDEMNEKHYQQLVSACEALFGTFDTVQIFCTRTNPDDEETEVFQHGKGNFYGRYGSVKRWIIENEDDMCYPLRQGDEEDDEDGEEWKNTIENPED